MKNLLFLFVLLFSANSYSQTSTEKWNSLQKRYEYFDSNGSMTGYKQYNSLRQSWEYYDLKTTNTGYQIQQPVSSLPDLKLLDNTLTSKQNRFDYNAKRIQTYILECRKYLDDSSMDTGLIQNIKESFNSNYVSVLNKKRYDVSSTTKANEILEWLHQGIISSIKIESEKYDANLEAGNPVGGYRVAVVNEQVYQHGKWTSLKEEFWNAHIFFDKDMLWFKRGDNKWMGRKLVLREHDSKLKQYIYDSESGLTVVDYGLKCILFYDMNNSDIRYMYLMGEKDDSIIAGN